MAADSRSYPQQPARLDLPAIEHEILAFWERDDTFRASIERRRAQGAPAFVFYDGPPFANGSPHYGHLLTGFVKDAVPRYQTMRGRLVERRFGWDCHGLPAEMAAEKELDVHGREAVEAYGIDRFNDHCRALVQRTTDEWYRYVTRQARWVDFVDSYKTMDLSFMESVIWAFRRLYDLGLIYEHDRVLPYCWECETPLSNFETRQDDSYRLRVDPAITVAFRLPAVEGTDPADGELRLLAWTTTPWTLPSNLALAVREDITYVLLRATDDGPPFVLAKDRLAAYESRFSDLDVIAEITGARLVGRPVVPLFPFFTHIDGAFRVLAADFVTTDEGTGIVQLAPGFGEEDQQACEANGIPVVCPVDSEGRYTAEIPWYEGMQVFDANPRIIEHLKTEGVLVTEEAYEHSYPHCWRTDTPLIYRAVSSWFVNVTALKDRLLERNELIEWVPNHVKHGAFGKWLEGARDWSLTRNRFWGSPIPVWKSDDPRYPRIDVYGSLDELERDFGVRPSDLHRPAIDTLTRPNPDDPTGRSMMRRVPDVLDCWFESGSMPFAQLHYPFDHRASFEETFPADFIVEFIGQTRGWFYTLHVLAVALFDQPPFRHCMAHGILLGSDGRKLSKRLRNFPDPWEVFEELGADAMRWFLLSSSVLRGQEMLLERDAMFDTVKRVINPIWNAFGFLTLYARADGTAGRHSTSSTNLLDHYILAKTASLRDEVTHAMDAYDLSRATDAIEGFLDALTNWYVRRSRDRFWAPVGAESAASIDKQAAYDTLHTVLVTLAELCAPFLPMLSEYVYRSLTGERSVHLLDWPEAKDFPRDPAGIATMELVREICSAVHSIRKATGLRARLPLRSVIIAHASDVDLDAYLGLIAEETNVKEVQISDAFDTFALRRLVLDPRALGPRFGATTQTLLRAAREGRFELHEDHAVVDGVRLEHGDYQIVLEPRNANTMRLVDDRRAVVALDTTIDDELAEEGLARDVIRLVQQHRKDHDYEITTRITLHIGGLDHAPRILGALERHGARIASEVLADALLLGHGPLEARLGPTQVTVGDEVIEIATEPSARPDRPR